MKIPIKFMSTAIVAISLSTAYAAMADDSLASPRAQANQIKSVSGKTTDMLDRSVRVLPPKLREMQASTRKVEGNTIDRIDRSFGAVSAKFREKGMATKEIQVAPLK
jgi:hypothetical protein